jgi:hypothetical protein
LTLVHDLRDDAHELITDLSFFDHSLPRVLLRLLEAEGDPLAVTVDVENLHFDGVADREDLAGVVDV